MADRGARGGRLIAFSGVDCSGKTTQLELLAEHLRSRGERVRTLWYRPGYSRALDGARAVARRVLGRRGGPALPTARDPGRQRAFARPAVSLTWVAMATADTAVQYGARLRLWRRQGSTVLVDRYLDDAALDFELRFPQHRVATALAMSALEAASPRPDLHLLLLLPHHVMLERAALKDEPFPDDPSVRDARFDAYTALAESSAVTVIDADASIDEVHQRVVRALVRVGERVAG